MKNSDITIDMIRIIVCFYYGIDKKYLLQSSRKAHIIEKRQLFHYLCHINTSSSLNIIGAYEPSNTFNHATILNSIKKAKKRLLDDKNYHEDFIEINTQIKNTGLNNSLLTELRQFKIKS